MLYSELHSIILTPGWLRFVTSVSLSFYSGGSAGAKWTTTGNITGLYPGRQFSLQWDNSSKQGVMVRFFQIQYTYLCCVFIHSAATIQYIASLMFQGFAPSHLLQPDLREVVLFFHCNSISFISFFFNHRVWGGRSQLFSLVKHPQYC